MAPDVFKKPKPDLYWGARSEQIDRRVRPDLDRQIVPSTKDTYPATPNSFLEAKGPDGSVAVKTMQACYDGAIGARAVHALQNYGQAEPTFDKKAYAISSTYHDGTLEIHSHHPSQPLRLGEPSQYHMTSLRGFLPTDSPEIFRQGVGAFQNARDLATQQRDVLINQANKVARPQPATSLSFGSGEARIESEESSDESDLDRPKVASRTKRQDKDPYSVRESRRSSQGDTRTVRDDQRSAREQPGVARADPCPVRDDPQSGRDDPRS